MADLKNSAFLRQRTVYKYGALIDFTTGAATVIDSHVDMIFTEHIFNSETYFLFFELKIFIFLQQITVFLFSAPTYFTTAAVTADNSNIDSIFMNKFSIVKQSLRVRVELIYCEFFRLWI